MELACLSKEGGTLREWWAESLITSACGFRGVPSGEYPEHAYKQYLEHHAKVMEHYVQLLAARDKKTTDDTKLSEAEGSKRRASFSEVDEGEAKKLRTGTSGAD